MKLNKYKELHTTFLNTLLDIHNANVAYERRPGRTTTKELRRLLNVLKEQIIPLREELQHIQRQINVEKSERFYELQKLKKEKKDE